MNDGYAYQKYENTENKPSNYGDNEYARYKAKMRAQAQADYLAEEQKKKKGKRKLTQFEKRHLAGFLAGLVLIGAGKTVETVEKKDGEIGSNIESIQVNGSVQELSTPVISALATLVENSSSLEEAQKQYLTYMDIAFGNSSGRYGYFEVFNDLCAKKGFITEKDAEVLNNTNQIMRYNENSYFVNSINVGSIESISTVTHYYNSQLNVVGSDPVMVDYIDENGEHKFFEISNDAYMTYTLDEEIKLKIQTYFSNNRNMVLSQDFIDDLMQKCDVDNKDIYKNVFTLSTGEVLYSGDLNDSVFIEFGKNNNGVLTYQISKEENVIYKSSSNFVPLSSKIPYKLFVNTVSFISKDKYMDEIMNQGSIYEGLYTLQQIMKDVKIGNYIGHETAEFYNPDTNQIANEYFVKYDVDFIEPIMIKLDGQECYARDIIAFGSNGYGNDDINICFPDGSKERLMRWHEADLEGEWIFASLDWYLPSGVNNIELSRNDARQIIQRGLCGLDYELDSEISK